jgi:CubicO group peptidase (beta-lactamase class C family)
VTTTSTERAAVGGWVAPGFEPVRDAFAVAVPELGAGGGAFAAYVDGRAVVDLWAGLARAGQAWVEDTRAVIMSATKGMVAISAQILADRGLLDVDAPVVDYWPEFGQNGKQAVTVRQLLTHTAGVLSFPGFDALLGWDGVGWDDYDAIAAGFAAATPCWSPGSRCGYHAMSYGWLVGELVRRISGLSVGRFFADNVARPLQLDISVGTPLDQQDRVAHVVDRIRAGLPLPVRLVYPLVQRQVRNPATLSGQAYLASAGKTIVDRAETIFRNERFLAAEIPSGNGTATARSLARLYAALSMNGELDGVRIVSAESVRTFGTEVLREPDALLTDLRLPLVKRMLARPVGRSLGYLMNQMPPRELPHFGPNPRAFGHEGAGGQVSFADVDRRIAAGFVRSELAATPKTAARLVQVLYTTVGGG